MQAIYFDMDGTLFDLYNVDNWLDKLRANDPSPYREAKIMIDAQELATVCEQFINQGIKIGIISWLPLDSNKEYNRLVRQAKRDMVHKYIPYATEIHIVKYGTPKHWVRQIADSILIDDNEAVRKAWNGRTIDASNTTHMMNELKKLVDMPARMW